MLKRRLAPVWVTLLVCGCQTPPLQSIDQTIAELSARHIDEAPAPAAKPAEAQPATSGAAPAAGSPGPMAPQPNPAPAANAPPKPAENLAPAGAGQAGAASASQAPSGSEAQGDGVVRASFAQSDGPPPRQQASPLHKFELMIPKEVPGSETPLVTLPREAPGREAGVARLFPPMMPLPEEPVPLTPPIGRPYTLADFQKIAAANSPVLRQAASDVEQARGFMIQAGLYPNPTIAYQTSPNANNTGSTTLGLYIDQPIKTGGKLRIQTAQAQMNLVNAELALRRARFDLATTIRTDFYNLVVAKETVRVTKGLAHFTDEIYRLQADLLAGGFAASHEPAALRSQAFIVRLAYRQAIANYVMAWKQLVADMGLKQLPFSAVEGQVDRLIPYYDYDTILAHVLRNHTDVLTALSTLRGMQYGLKLAQVTPVPDIDVFGSLWKEHQVFPLQNYYQVGVGIPFPIWDRNQGNIRAAAASLVRASEGPHAAEVALTTGLADAYAGYKSNLAAVEYYRRSILPDQVRYYRGVFERRKIDPGVAFGDLVQAQQVLVADVTAYLGVLGTLWSSVVNVANYLQTEDLYQLGTPLELPQLPDFDSLHSLPCPHGHVVCPEIGVGASPTPLTSAGATAPRERTSALTLAQWIAEPVAPRAVHLLTPATDPDPSAGNAKPKPASSAPPADGTTFGKAFQEFAAKLLGVPESPSEAPTPASAPPAAQPPESPAPNLTRRSSAASARSSS